MTQQTRSSFSFQKAAEGALQTGTAYRLAHNNKSIKPAGDEYSITQHQIKTSNAPSLTMPLTLADTSMDTSQETPSLASTFTGDSNSDGAASAMTAEAVASPLAGDINAQPGLIASAMSLAIGTIGIGAGASALAGASHSARSSSSHMGLQNRETNPQRQPVAPSSPASDTENAFHGQPQRLEHEHQDASRNSLIDSKDVELMTSAGKPDSTPQTADPAQIALSETVDFINQAKRMGIILGDMAPIPVNAPQGLFIDNSVQLERMTDGTRSSLQLGLNQRVFITFAGSANSTSTEPPVADPSLPALPIQPGHEAGNDTPTAPNAGSNTNDRVGNSGSTGGSAGSSSEQQGPGDSSSDPDAGSQGQGEGQQEPRKTAPEYDQDALSVQVTYNNEAHTFESAKAMFEGNGTKATHVKITEIKKNGSEAADEGTLKYNGQNVTENTVIELAQLNNLVWNASKAEGGSFKFTAVQPDGTAFATPAAPQIVTINEAEATPPAPKVPSYSGDAVTANVAHNKQDFNFADLKAQFEGNSDAVKATHIKITEIKKDASGTNADANTLKYKGQDVTDETVIAVAELNDLVWNAALAKGGSFKFTAVKEGGAAYENGPAAQSVTINEDAEPAPSYGSESLSAPVAHNQNLDFSSHAEHFKGSGNTKATHIKITEIKKDASGTDADDENTLKYNEKPVKEDTLIDLEQLSKLVWDASKAVGGSFKFTPVKDNGDAYEVSPAAQTVTINEAPYTAEGETQEVAKNAHTTLGKALFDFSVEDKAEPGFVKIVSLTPEANEMAGKFVVNSETKTAYQVVKVDAGITKANAIAAAEKMGGKLLEISDTTELGWIQGKTELMSKLTIDGAGTEGKGFWFANPSSGAVPGVTADKEGISVSSEAANTLKFSDATSDNADTGTLSGYVVEFSNYDADKLPSLMLDSGSQKDPVAQNDVIDFNDIKGDKLSWNSVFNNGGEVKFVEVTSKENATPVEGAVEKTITITEASAVVDPLLQNHVIL